MTKYIDLIQYYIYIKTSMSFFKEAFLFGIKNHEIQKIITLI